ncbi:MAG: carboxypeptidase regulatory-like domain-containing protein, partial [Candidatus Neomarinimicrobiota bacterium]|nr:carboxypeptidase regulatory-like domain-containing protein [Candidatus Neomarinimicrobiota bacterium]
GVSGKVLNAVDRSPIANVLVTISGQTGTTDTDGNYTILNVGPGDHDVAGTSDGFCPFSAPFTIPDGYEDEFFTYNFSMSPILEGEQIRMVLNWGATPNDLDSHLKTPEIEGNTHHIFYSNRGSYTSVPYVKLDTDVTQGYGPETITINQLFTGTYTYYIKNFSGGSSGLKNSNAVVQVYNGESCAANIIEVPTDTNGLFWHVCDIDGATGDVTVVNQIQSSAP